MHYTSYTTPQLQLHYITNTAALHHTLHPAVVGEMTTATIATTPTITTPTTFRSISDSLCHSCFKTTNLSYRFPILKLPPPPCAVLLVSSHLHIFSSSHLLSLALLPSCLLALLLSCSFALLPSCPLALLPSCPLALLPSSLSFFSISLLRRGAVPTRRHEMQPFRAK